MTIYKAEKCNYVPSLPICDGCPERFLMVRELMQEQSKVKANVFSEVHLACLSEPACERAYELGKQTRNGVDE